MKLTPRQEQILDLIIQLYSQNEEPVGSRTLLENSRLKVSPATVRNDMMALEQLGFLNKAHTSSGRIPSFDGYRFYIDRLIDREDRQVEFEPAQSLTNPPQAAYDFQHFSTGLADKVSRLTKLPVVLTIQQDRYRTVKDFHLLALNDFQLLASVILDSGGVESEIFTLNQSIKEETLNKLAAFLKSELTDLTLDVAFQRLQLTLPLRIQQIVGLQLNFASLIQKAIDRHDRTFYHCAGKNQLFDLLDPKNTATSMKALFNMMDGDQEWLDYLTQRKAGIDVTLDFQVPPYQLRNLALLSTKLKVNTSTLVIALIGPAAMAYDKVIHLMHQLMFELTNY